MNRIAMFSSAAALCLLTGNAFAQFAGSNLVVSLVDSGDITKPPTSAASQVRLVAYTRVNGRPVTPTGQTYDLPAALFGGNHALTQSGSATSEGELTLSDDGKYLLLVGYDAAPGTLTVATSAAATVNRVVGRIDWTKPAATAIDTTTALNNIFDKTNIRGASSPDGQTFYLGGTATSQGGVALATLGATTATPSYGGTVTKNVRYIRSFGGNLYVSAATSGGSLYGVGQVTAGATTPLAGFPTVMGPSSYGFYFLNAKTLYVADDRVSASGGIQKWVNVGGVWQLLYTLNIPAVGGTGVVGARGLAGSPFFDEDAGTTLAQLYAVTTDNRIVTVIDDNPGATFDVVDTGTLSRVFRGVEVIRPTTVTVGGLISIPGVSDELNPGNIQIPVHIEFRPLPLGSAPSFTRTVTVAADNTYTVTGVPAGVAYELHVKGDNTLAGNHNVDTYSQDDIDADVILEPGDASNDNAVDPTDFGIFVTAYNSDITVPGSGYDPACDFNFDGAVDPTDFGLFVGTYNTIGEP